MENAPDLQMSPPGVGREAGLVNKDNSHCFSFLTYRSRYPCPWTEGGAVPSAKTLGWPSMLPSLVYLNSRGVFDDCQEELSPDRIIDCLLSPVLAPPNSFSAFNVLL